MFDLNLAMDLAEQLGSFAMVFLSEKLGCAKISPSIESRHRAMCDGCQIIHLEGAFAGAF
jgi:hypothetical protein